MNIALAQIDVKAGSPEVNFKTMKKYIEQAKSQNVDIIAFPELCVSGYLIGDLWTNDDFCRNLMAYNEKIKELSDGIVIIYGNVYLEERDSIEIEEINGNYKEHTRGFDGRKIRYNAAYVVYNNKFLERERCLSDIIPKTIQPKTLLPNYRYFDDKRYFYSSEEWSHLYADSVSPFITKINDKKIKIGIQLCEDMWHDDYRLNPIYHLTCSDIIFNLSASPWTFNKNKARDKRVKNLLEWNRKKTQYTDDGPKQVYQYPPYAYVNCCGSQNNGKNILCFDGASTVYDRDGKPKIFANSDYEEELLIFNHENISDTKEKRKKEYAIPRKYQAIIRGIKHMSEVTGIWRYVIGLSGGIDSAVVATLLVDAIGKENVIAVNMPSEYNSKKTITAAEKIAKRLGVKYITVPIKSLTTANNSVIELAKSKLNKNNEIRALKDLTYENIQAKIRGANILSNLAGELGCFFSCNGNKVEVALGYATLYGDWGGAIAPIGDLTKAEVYKMAKYLNKMHKKNPIPKNILPNGYFNFDGKIKPSAELKNDQVDPIKVGYHCAIIEKIMDYKKYSASDIMEWYYNRELAKKLGISSSVIYETHSIQDKEYFLEDLKWLFEKIRANVFKRVQSPPIIVTSKTAFGYDLRESILPKYEWGEKEKAMEKLIMESKDGRKPKE